MPNNTTYLWIEDKDEGLKKTERGSWSSFVDAHENTHDARTAGATGGLRDTVTALGWRLFIELESDVEPPRGGVVGQ